jgi:hypothetical protein
MWVGELGNHDDLRGDGCCGLLSSYLIIRKFISARVAYSHQLHIFCLTFGDEMPSTTVSKKSAKGSKPAKTSKRESKPLSSAKRVEPEPEPESSDASEAEAEAAGSGAEGDDYLYGFSTDDDDSSDDEAIVEVGVDVGKLPTVAKDDATVQKKLERAKRQQASIYTLLLLLYADSIQKQAKGVISISRLPHGFYEDQLRAYFSQFGEVLRLRVSRNKKVRFLGCLLKPNQRSLLDRKVETLCVPRVRLDICRASCCGDYGQLFAHGTHT